MTVYEILNSLIALLAIIVSMNVWFGQRRLQRESIDMQRATAKLAEKQLEIILRAEAGKQAARISVELFRDGHNYRFRLTNVGEAEAKDVNLKLLLGDSDDSPLVDSEYRERIPVKRMAPGASITLMAVMHLGTPTAYNVFLSWKNPDNSVVEEETFVTM